MYAFIYVFKANQRNKNDPVSLLRKALSELLVSYYPLSGKLLRRKIDRKLQLVCNLEGVPFAVATADRDLRSLNYIENLSDEFALQLVHELDVNYQSEIGCHPFSLQVTKFPCGGFTIGIAVTHALCDGYGVATIFNALTELASGKSEPSVVPVWQREKMVEKLDDEPANVPGADKECLLAISPYMPSSSCDMVIETIDITAENMKKLKDKVVLKESFTTFEVLCAYLWKSTSRALKLNIDGITVLKISVGIRHVLDPPLPEGYYGNAYVDVFTEITAGELDESSISDIVKLVKRAKKTALDKRFIEEQLRNTERLVKEDAKFKGVTDGILLMTDLRNTGLFRPNDFGWNEPVNIWPLTPQEIPSNIGVIMRPSKLDPSMEGGAKVVMTLPRDAMADFKKETNNMNKLSFSKI
ncbi:unnamed protein product [Microthlaspi erraticum]|uniref:Uncharacterized protein n=1 Tax=Microthlaspi erraticum TaxID=1685480 RepID=A0A6D2K7E1_9BRAS|nr:unnamed protein product [Microthlaspi erraticum]CAA7048855.1 unnamed protein product [Microthlaspi erraticum]